MAQYVYVAKAGLFTKIGISKTPLARLASLKFKPYKLMYVLRCREARPVEQLALLTLGEHHVEGEYLNCTTRVAVAAVRYAAAELFGGCIVMMDAEPDRWRKPVDNSLELRPAPLADL